MMTMIKSLPRIVTATAAKVAEVLFVVLILSLWNTSSSDPSQIWRPPHILSTTVNAFQYHSSSLYSKILTTKRSVAGSNQIMVRYQDTLAFSSSSSSSIRAKRTKRRFTALTISASKENTDTTVSLTSATTTNVLVIGGTSGIGQLVTQKLANRQRRHPPFLVRATSRSKARGEALFQDTNDDDNNNNNNIHVVELDLLQENTTQLKEAMEGVSVVVVSVGTTAFPTTKWKGGNNPVAIDNVAVTRIAQMASQISSVQQVIIVTSVGVERTNVMPFLILNLFGVLDAKRAGEDAIRQYSTTNSGYQYCIIRPGRLVGGPFTNFDVAKLLQIQGGTENGVTMSRGDTLLGDCKRDACAECIVQCIRTQQTLSVLNNNDTSKNNLEFSIVSNDQPALNDDEWSVAFQSLL